MNNTGIITYGGLKNKKRIAILFQVYLTLAPINWLPFVSPGTVNMTKYVLVAILCYYTFLMRGINVKPYYFFSLDYLFLIVICAAPAMIKSYDSIWFNLLDYVFIFLMYWIIRGSYLSRNELIEIFYKVALVIGAIGLLSLLSAITHVTIISPAPWHDAFSSSAFGGYRTGWSNSLFLYMPLLLFYFLQTNEKKKKIYCVLAIAGIIASQVLSGGRSGFVGSILAILIFSKFNIKGIIVIALLFLITAQFVSVMTLTRFFRASDEQIENKAGVSKLDKISSGRLVGYELGGQFFLNSPLWGNGFGASEVLSELHGYKVDIHNTWLKRLVDGGLLLVVPIIILFYNLYKSAIKNIKTHHLPNNYLFMFRSLFFLAILISMGEPNYMIGSFQGEAFFWALAGTCLNKF